MSSAAPSKRFSDVLLGSLVWAYMRINTATLRWKIEGLEHLQPLLDANRPLVVAAWHSRLLLFPVLETRILRRRQDPPHPTSIIVSNSKDGNITNQACGMLGLHIIRGSTARKDRRKDKGGVAGARAALRALRKSAVVCMTIDGPRGPAEKVPVEPVKLAQQAGAHVVTMGLSARGKKLKTWDRLLLPLPFSKGCLVFGPPIETSKQMDSEALRARIEQQMHDVSAQAHELVDPEAAIPNEVAEARPFETGHK